MRLLYGGTPISDTGWAELTWSRELKRNAAGIGVGFLYAVDCSRLGFTVSGQADADTKGAAIEATLRLEAVDLALYRDDDTASFKSVSSAAATFSGVRCVKGPTWSSRPGAQHLTWLEYSARFEWETSFGLNILLDFDESVEIAGGVSMGVAPPALNSPPIEQQTLFQFPYTITQTGYAVGYLQYPTSVATPIIPLVACRVPPRRRRTTPKRVGDRYQGFRVDWSYVWERASVPPGTNANPHLWTD